MNLFRHAAFAVAVLCLAAPAQAQKTKAAINTEIGAQFPDNNQGQITPQNLRSVTGDIVNSIMPTAPVTNGNAACYDGTSGLLKDCSGTIPNSALAPGAANTFKGSLNGSTTSDIALTACTLSYQITKWVAGTGWQCGLNPVLPSRTVAASLDLSAFTGITTQGYALPADGGRASYLKVAAGTVLTDTFVNCNPCTLAPGSAYTNATYNGVPLSGGAGQTCVGQVIVAGGVVTSVGFAVPCVTHKVGDVLTTANTNIGGTGSGFSYTVTSISTPTGSFTDNAGNLWQYVSDGFPNVLQFGCIGDWNGSDGAATNNTNCIRSVTAFASLPIASAQANVFGNRIWFPRGAYMTCGNGQFLSSLYDFPIPAGVTFTGMGFGATSLRQCAADPSGTHYIAFCDSYAAVGEFGCKIENMTVDSSAINNSTGGIAVLYSNSGQQFALAENVNVIAGFKSCIKYEIGKGGAANDIWNGINCVQTDAAVNAAFLFNAASVQHFLTKSVCASSPNGGATSCISNVSGRLVVDGLDVEGFVTGLAHTNTTAGNNGVYRNVQQNSTSCAQAISIIAGSGGNMLFENIATSCPVTIQNGLSGGTNFTGNIVKPIICVNSAVCS